MILTSPKTPHYNTSNNMEQTIKTATQKRAIARANMTPEEKQIHLEKRRIQRKENPLSEEQKEKRRIYQKKWRAEKKERAEEKADEEIITCEKCFLTECCCEADRLQVIQDDENARARGLIEMPNGKWVRDEEEGGKICKKCGEWSAWNKYSFQLGGENLMMYVCDVCYYEERKKNGIPIWYPKGVTDLSNPNPIRAFVAGGEGQVVGGEGEDSIYRKVVEAKKTKTKTKKQVKPKPIREFVDTGEIYIGIPRKIRTVNHLM